MGSPMAFLLCLVGTAHAFDLAALMGGGSIVEDEVAGHASWKAGARVHAPREPGARQEGGGEDAAPDLAGLGAGAARTC